MSSNTEELLKIHYELEKLKDSAITEEKLKQRISLIIDTISISNESYVSKTDYMTSLINTTVNDIISSRLRSIVDNAVKNEMNSNKGELFKELSSFILNEQRLLGNIPVSKDEILSVEKDLNNHINTCPAKSIVREEFQDKISTEMANVYKALVKNKQELSELIQKSKEKTEKELKEDVENMIKRIIYENKHIGSKNTESSISEGTPIKFSLSTLASLLIFVFIVAGNIYFTFYMTETNTKGVAENKALIKELKIGSLMERIKIIEKSLDELLDTQKEYKEINVRKELESLEKEIEVIQSLSTANGKLGNNNLNTIGRILEKIQKLERR